MLTGILGLPIFPWTPTTAFALGDANAANFRYLNHFFETNRAQSVERLDAIERKYQGIPWVNTIAADSTGKAYYADIGSVPNVSNAQDRRLQRRARPVRRTRACACRSSTARAARAPTTPTRTPSPRASSGRRNLPSLFRDDYVTNSNDSYWLSNPEQPLEGFARIIGDERTARALRTRLGLRMVQQRLDGSDGLPGKGFTLRQLQDAMFNNRQYAGELFATARRAVRGQRPSARPSTSACCDSRLGPAATTSTRRGALLFRRFASRLLVNPVSSALPPAQSPFATPFDADDPVNTPNGLNTLLAERPARRSPTRSPTCEGAGIPLDAPLRDFQYELRGGGADPDPRRPGHASASSTRSTSTWDPARATRTSRTARASCRRSSFPRRRCPRVRTILTYSQSTSPRSRWFADQTRLYAKKRWVRPPFCPKQMRRARFVSKRTYRTRPSDFVAAANRNTRQGLQP